MSTFTPVLFVVLLVLAVFVGLGVADVALRLRRHHRRKWGRRG